MTVAGAATSRTRLAGVLVFVGVIVGVFSVVPVLEEPGYLNALPGRQRELLSGAAFQALMVPTTAGFALALFPILRRADEGLALGFVGFRFIACGFHILAACMLPLLLCVVQGPLAEAAAGGALMAETLRLGRDLVNHVGVVGSIAMGDALLFVVMLRWRLVPWWLAGWGLAGAALATVATAAVLVQQLAIVAPAYLALMMPLGLQSLVLGGWLAGFGMADRSMADAVP